MLTVKVGQMEATMFKKFCQGSNLTARIVDLDLPEPLHSLAKKVRDSLATTYQGALLDESIALSGDLRVETRVNSEYKLAAEEQEALRSAGLLTPRICSKLIRNGLEVYEAYTSSTANSAISFQLQPSRSPDAEEMVGRIVRIADDGTGRPGSVKLVVQQFQPLKIPRNMRFFDPYLRYPELGARLVSSELSPTLLVIDARSVRGHLATCPFRGERRHTDIGLPKDSMVTLALDRVSIIWETCWRW